MIYEIKTSPGNFFDFISIIEIRLIKGIKINDDLKQQYSFAMTVIEYDVQLKKIYDHLRHINELIWWCMDRQREYDVKTADFRREIAVITAELNDLRDGLKKEINLHFQNENTGEEKKYAGKEEQ